MGDGQIQLSRLREAEVRAALGALLESASFRTSKRCRDFLDYVVNRTLSGPLESLKERSIGVELFELPPDFDASQHTIVRVTANEVRKKLAQYYLTADSAAHPVRIELPPGSYRAEFRWPAPEPPAEPEIEPVPEPQPEPPARRWPLLAGAGLVALLLVALALWQWIPGRPQARPASGAGSTKASAAVAEGDALRLIVGAATPYVDRSGRQWGPDRYFTGGRILARPEERILRTLDPDIYRHSRIGEFQYAIPLKPGLYELHLHFAETGLADFISAESSGEGQRVFRVLANGVNLLEAFDVVADAAGANIADERIFRGIAPGADGLLHLAFSTLRGSPMLSALELLPESGGKSRPTRIRAGWTASWQDSAGQPWQADSYFMGGNSLLRQTNPARAGASASHDPGLYASERWGHFSYAIPAAEGRYRVTLRFCEGHYGRHNSGEGGAGSRRFDVYSNGVALLRNFDIYKEAGGEGLPVEKQFSGVRPNAQGKIVLTFVPVEGMACVNAIEVVEE